MMIIKEYKIIRYRTRVLNHYYPKYPSHFPILPSPIEPQILQWSQLQLLEVMCNSQTIACDLL